MYTHVHCMLRSWLFMCVHLCVCTHLLQCMCGEESALSPPFRVLWVQPWLSGLPSSVSVTNAILLACHLPFGVRDPHWTWSLAFWLDWWASKCPPFILCILPVSSLCHQSYRQSLHPVFTDAGDLNSRSHLCRAGTLSIEHDPNPYGGGVLFCFCKTFWILYKTKSGLCLGAIGNPGRFQSFRGLKEVYSQTKYPSVPQAGAEIG